MDSERLRSNRPARCHEQGGIVILVALMLLTLLSVAAFSLSRTVIREIGVSGNVFQAGKADAASDAGLDWFMAWEAESQRVGGTVPTSATKALAMTTAVNTVYDAGLSVVDKSDNLKWAANVSGTDGMVLLGANVDGSASQAFNLQVTCLGKDDGAQAGGGETTRGNPSGNTDVRANVGQLYAWEVTSTGQAILPGDAWRYQSIRAGKIVVNPKSKH